MSAQSSSGFLRNAELAAGVRRRGKVEVKIKEGIEGVVETRPWTFATSYVMRPVAQTSKCLAIV
jgi:hypothetical protein